MLQRLSFILLIIFGFIGTINAEVKLPAIFGNGMVLQRNTNAAIWGTADKNNTVEIITSWNKKSYTAKTNADGKWKIKVATPEAGGPFSISISDGDALTLENVLIGEVWVCSGQSNMQMIMNGYFNQPVLGSNEAIATSTNKSIRLMTIERDKSLETKEDFKGEWMECNPGSVGQFSATAYFFGRMIQKALDVPVGLICSAWGGTRIEPWISENGFKEFDWVNLPDKASKEDFNHQTPTVLYNAMISPMVGYSIKGAIWYQGESNRNEPKEYEKLMPGLVENWRTEWGIGDFSFYYCQIAPYNYGTNGLNSAFLREAQYNASMALPNMGMACLMDVGEEFCIHPANKEAAGKRLAYLALAKTYGLKGFEFSGPKFDNMTVEGSVVKLKFRHAKYGLSTFGKELVNFKVAGEDKHFVPATAIITREGITLSSPTVIKPVAVRYAFEDFVIGELYNVEGLPASSFRTDDWDVK